MYIHLAFGVSSFHESEERRILSFTQTSSTYKYMFFYLISLESNGWTNVNPKLCTIKFVEG